MRLIILITILLIILTATAAQAQTYLPIIGGGGDVTGAEISYGIYHRIEANRWLDVECANGSPIAMHEDGLLRVVCR